MIPISLIAYLNRNTKTITMIKFLSLPILLYFCIKFEKKAVDISLTSFDSVFIIISFKKNFLFDLVGLFMIIYTFSELKKLR